MNRNKKIETKSHKYYHIENIIKNKKKTEKLSSQLKIRQPARTVEKANTFNLTTGNLVNPAIPLVDPQTRVELRH
jgi:hypothetical protein